MPSRKTVSNLPSISKYIKNEYYLLDAFSSDHNCEMTRFGLNVGINQNLWPVPWKKRPWEGGRDMASVAINCAWLEIFRGRENNKRIMEILKGGLEKH